MSHSSLFARSNFIASNSKHTTMKTTASNPPATKSATHTPGPWTAFPPANSGGDYSVLSGGVTAYGNFYVATLPNGEHDEARANASLMAAAPELLAALESSSAVLESLLNHEITDMCAIAEALHDARAAIAKARAHDRNHPHSPRNTP